MEQEVWVHGNSFKIENSFPVQVSYRGFGGVFGPVAGEGWPGPYGDKIFFLHYSIPITYTGNSLRTGIKLDRILVASNLSSPHIQFVSLYEGFNPLGSRIAVYPSGDSGHSVTREISVPREYANIKSSLGVTFGIATGASPTSRLIKNIEIHSVGIRTL